jgi:hypothetical protein
MDCVRGPCSDVKDGKVLRLALKLSELRLQIAEPAISLTAENPIGALFIDDHPRIVTAFLSNDCGRHEAELWAVSLVDLSRHRLSYGYTCHEWRLVNVPDGHPPEAIAEFSLPTSATATS